MTGCEHSTSCRQFLHRDGSWQFQARHEWDRFLLDVLDGFVSDPSGKALGAEDAKKRTYAIAETFATRLETRSATRELQPLSGTLLCRNREKPNHQPEQNQRTKNRKERVQGMELKQRIAG